MQNNKKQYKQNKKDNENKLKTKQEKETNTKE